MGRSILATFVALTVLAEAADARQQNPGGLLSEGRYLEAWANAIPQNIPEEYRASFRSQIEASYYAFTGRHLRAYEAFYEQALARLPEDHTMAQYDFSAYALEEAVSAIREAAREYQVVMINEYHHDARHRAFIARVVQVLAEDGFTHFAAETFTGNDELAEMQAVGYPILRAGHYSKEPVFADLLRQVMRDELELVAYEHTEPLACGSSCSQQEAIRSRERGQARNLAAALAEDPDGRFIVHVGIGHINETGDTDGDGVVEGWMAAELTALTGIDPLTVDQVSGSGYHDPRINSRQTRLSEQHDYSVPVVLQDESGQFNDDTRMGDVDMVVYHPSLEIGEHGRPFWLEMNGYRRAVRIEADVIPDQRPLLLQAFNA